MLTTHKADKSKVRRGGIFFHRVSEDVVRVMTTEKHAHLGDLIGSTTVRTLTHDEDTDAYSCVGKKTGDFEVILEEYIVYLR
jgi:hypothetical protein